MDEPYRKITLTADTDLLFQFSRPLRHGEQTTLIRAFISSIVQLYDTETGRQEIALWQKGLKDLILPTPKEEHL